ncbi:hypothetical protein ACTOS9_21785 (plasmid) [Bacillus subtilis]|uniref:Uncharacterized protein n=1 Tax=Bacillus subtilis TaxID=1423 RepID=A0A8I2BAU8_BACIU|nr:hypothetical protein [Bacillus subtilis]MBO3796470.1 hypothetical protein [Bacillus subtilis]WEY82935.1 hypothetical protein P5633_00015 [Bacillus subtilis]WGD64168.1 hypothetical protein P5648_22070 [Bacillus subtilis]WGD72641.1 hypothetical protein P5645_22225 [Bacillus subtilis]WGD74619.1 hypothetical protein P5631_00185 [Bacillus subtilis]
MVLKRNDFQTEKEYKKYTKTSEFLLNYSWEGKSEKEVIHEMALPLEEQVYLSEAMEQLKKENDFSGMSLDRYILKKLDESEQDSFDMDDVIFIERDE